MKINYECISIDAVVHLGKYDLPLVCLYISLRAAQDFGGTHFANLLQTEEAKCLDACLSSHNRKFPLLEREVFSFFNRKNRLQRKDMERFPIPRKNGPQ